MSTFDVVRVRSAVAPSDKAHEKWFVGYAPEKEQGLNARVVFGSLHVASETSYGDITVSALLFDVSDKTYEESQIDELLAGSEAVEALYDYARTSLRTVLAVIDSDAIIPRAAPEAEFGYLERVTSEDSTTEGKAEDVNRP
ncbi:hypothetical protein [Agromyces sp. NPDC056965]|uniref:hypothetical protein n=1 Tax=Agromyces sp. NPDC056965 TaxID=3345983 RepID=UPI003629B52F